jgi:hypothetical protein
MTLAGARLPYGPATPTARCRVVDSPRFRVRTLVLVIALAAGPLWAVSMIKRSLAFARLAQFHADAESRALALSDSLTGRARDMLARANKLRIRARNGPEPPELYRRREAKFVEQARTWEREGETERHRVEKIANYHARLAQKYRRASFHPWLVITPDRPPPQ